MKSIATFINDTLLGHKLDPFGKEDVLMTCLPYLIPLIMEFIYYQFLLFEHAWLGVLIIYSLFPLLDELFKLDLKNPNERQRKELEKNDLYFLVCLYVPTILDWYFFFRVLDHIAHFEATTWSMYNFPAFLLLFSNLQGAQMVANHEIYHKPGGIHKIIGTLNQSKNLYMHFTYEHLYGHHRKVATPEDPASA